MNQTEQSGTGDAAGVASTDLAAVLAARFREAIARAFPQLPGSADPLIGPTKQAALGDFQSNAAMGLAKQLGMKPRDVAAAIVANADLGDIAEALNEGSIAGPGFINIRLRGETLARLLTTMDGQSLGVQPPRHVQTVVVDLCGVNLAKQMHVGHLRSTVIGDSIARILERLGHRVIRQSHVGDWGLPIAMVTNKVQEEAAAGSLDMSSMSLDRLEQLYRRAQAECERDLTGLAAVQRYGLGPKLEAELDAQVSGATEAFGRARQTLLKLQNHDAETVAVWRRIYAVTMQACLANCARLHADVTDQHTAGESSYAEELAPLVDDLVKRGVAEPSDGALVVRVDGFDVPCMIRKSDGSFLYATTDLAGIRRRVQTLGASRVVYAVDARQSLHFALVFGAAIKAGYTTRGVGAEANDSQAKLEHAAFGTILGQDGRPFKTRSGENVKLSDLLDEAVLRARAAVDERSRDLSPAERDVIAEAVGIAAIKHADLSTERTRDYVFDFDRMLAFEGNTGPYLLYALVRVRSIFRKAAERGLADTWAAAPIAVVEPDEKTLAMALLRYPTVLAAAGAAAEPHRIVQYLYDLASAFSGFFDRCPVLQAEDARVRDSRLRLSDLTGRVLADGLKTLGIPTLERM